MLYQGVDVTGSSPPIIVVGTTTTVACEVSIAVMLFASPFAVAILVVV